MTHVENLEPKLLKAMTAHLKPLIEDKIVVIKECGQDCFGQDIFHNYSIWCKSEYFDRVEKQVRIFYKSNRQIYN